VREHGVSKSSGGLPLRLDGKNSRRIAKKWKLFFLPTLRKQICVPVELVDERLHHWEALAVMEEIQGKIVR